MTGRVSLVPLEARHGALTLEWMNDPEFMTLLNRTRVIGADEHERWLRALPQREDVRYFAVEDRAGAHLGNVWLAEIDAYHRKAEVRIVIGRRDAQNAGVGTQAIDLVARAGFDDLGLQRLSAFVLAFNVRARRAFERAGFAVEGVLRRDRRSGNGWVDAILLARCRTV